MIATYRTFYYLPGTTCPVQQFLKMTYTMESISEFVLFPKYYYYLGPRVVLKSGWMAAQLVKGPELLLHFTTKPSIYSYTDSIGSSPTLHTLCMKDLLFIFYNLRLDIRNWRISIGFLSKIVCAFHISQCLVAVILSEKSTHYEGHYEISSSII